MGRASILLVGLCYLCITETAADIDMDYYLGSLRSSCLGRKGENICQIDCQGAVSICFQGQCICETKTAAPIEQTLWLSDSKKVIKEVSDSIIDVSGDPRAGILLAAGIKEIDVMGAEDYVEKASKTTSLRHHIAHFCPNLDEARVCIKKCMETGRPAFCGKDHVCYCGHKYSAHDTIPEIDPEEVMSNFKDLYEKYFGRNPNERGHTIIEETVSSNSKPGRKKPNKRGWRAKKLLL